MKAKDITTPGDYEAKDYRGLHKVHVLRIDKVEERSYGSYSDVSGHKNINTYVVAQREGSDSESRYTLMQIIRPWADAMGEHASAEGFRQEGERIRARLECSLGDLATEVTALGSIMVRLTREQADRLAELLEKSAP